MSRPQRFTGSPASAYRADAAGRQHPFGADDDRWLVVANALHRAATADKRARRMKLLAAVSEAMDVVPEEDVEAHAAREWLGDRTVVDAIIVLILGVQESGAFRLAACMVDDILEAAELSKLERGRILALRARLEWKIGNLDDADERYGYIEQLGKRHRLLELQARAHVGWVALAQLRGNLPALRRHSEEAVKLAGGLRHAALERLGWQGLTMAAAKTSDHQQALEAGWRVIELSKGGATLEAEALQNLGQLMLEAGHAEVARSCFAAVMTRTAPARLMLFALGGLALASARVGSEATVEWAMHEVWRARGAAVARYAVGVALLECAIALGLLGRGNDAARFRTAALDVATSGGFHELEFRARELDLEAKPKVQAPAPLPAGASEIVESLSALEPEQLPARLELVDAPA